MKEKESAKLTETNKSQNLPAFNNEQVDLLVSLGVIPEGTPPQVVALYGAICKETGLSPFKRQIYIIKRYSKDGVQFRPQTGIDGFRAIAESTGQYAGSDDPVFDDEEKPRKATVTVWRLVGGVRCPFTATARWEQYRPEGRQGFMWDKMPHLMLSKCAESLALRKAFPAKLSGLYTHEEMAQAGDEQPTAAPPTALPAAPQAAEPVPVKEPEIEPPLEMGAGSPEAESKPKNEARTIRMLQLFRERNINHNQIAEYLKVPQVINLSDGQLAEMRAVYSLMTTNGLSWDEVMKAKTAPAPKPDDAPSPQ